MNAYQPKDTQTYGYDNTYRSFNPTGTLIFGYDVSANWFTRFNFEASRGTAVRLHQFTGKERDQESGLDYFGARYYGSALGRFTSPDKPFADQHVAEPQSWNLYTYVRNNPLSMVDPNGTDALWIKDTGQNTATLVIPVHFTGSGATPDRITAILDRAVTLQNGSGTVNVMVMSTDKPVNGVLNQMDLSPGLDTKNFGQAGEGVNKLGGNNAHIDTPNDSDNSRDSTGAAVHDTLHFAGIKDEYVEGPRDQTGNRTSVPAPGYDNSNIMTDRAGTHLNADQVNEAPKNKSTKQCSTDGRGGTKCN